MKIANCDYSLRLMELKIDEEVYHIQYKKLGLEIEVKEVSKWQDGSFIPCHFNQIGVIDYSIGLIVRELLDNIKNFLRKTLLHIQ